MVDFELEDLEPLELAERRVARAKVVHGQPNAASVQLVHGGDGSAWVVHGHPFGQLQFQAAGFQAGFCQCAFDDFGQLRLAKLNGRKIHGHGQTGDAAHTPGLELR